MIKLTKRKILIYATALHWFINYDNCNPDVGMGSSKASLSEDLLPGMILLTKEEIIMYKDYEIRKEVSPCQ